MFKRFAQILALATPMLLVACNSGTTTTTSGGTTTTTSSTGFSGTYTGNVTGLNAGPVTIIVSSSNVVSGSFSITNRQVDCAPRGGTCETVVTGTVDAAGNIKGDFVDSGIATMHFNGKIVGDTITEGTWGEYIHDPVPDGAFTASRPAGSGGTTTTTSSGTSTCEGSYVGSVNPPEQSVRLANKDRQLAEGGPLGGGVDGGIYLEGSFAFETNAACQIVKGSGSIFGHDLPISGTVTSNKQNFTINHIGGPIEGSVDANNRITGKFMEGGGREWVHGVLDGTFVSKGKI